MPISLVQYASPRRRTIAVNLIRPKPHYFDLLQNFVMNLLWAFNLFTTNLQQREKKMVYGS